MKFINNFLMFFCFLVSLFSGNYFFILGLIFLLYISLKIRKNNKNLEFVYLIFIFISYVLGFVHDYYHKIYFFDALAHSLFGLVSSIYALPLLKKIGNYDINLKIFNIIFIIIFTLSLASLWEIFEFIIDKIFVTPNMQRSLNNTMKDIISAFLFSIVYSFLYFEKSSLFDRLFITKN